MSWMWVTRPEELHRVKGLEAEGERLLNEVAAITSLSTEAACRLCGDEVGLTEEHAPSKKAGNVGRMVRGVIDSAASAAGDSIVWKGQVIQGAKYDSLCGPCNSKTGSWYNGAYVRLVRTCATIAKASAAGTVCDVDVFNPQRVAKQALVSIVATSQPGLTARYPSLRALLLDRLAQASIAPSRLWLYLKANPGGVSTGLATALDIDRGAGHLIAGFSFWPLGWILTLDGAEVTGTLDVSAWTTMGYMDRGPVAAKIPCQWAISPYPGDFRGPADLPDDAWKVTR